MTHWPVDLSTSPDVDGFFDPTTNTISYIVKDPHSNACAIIDPVLNLDIASGRVSFDCANAILDVIHARGLKNEWIIETHVHADHLTAAPYLSKRTGGRIAISERITEVQRTFAKVFNEGVEFPVDGSQFDKRFNDGDQYRIGQMKAFCIATPGHTPACMVHVIGDAAFTGDTLFMPDGGSARADFPGGDAGTLYDSIHKVLSLPDELRLFMCHDYGPGGREIAWETTVGEQRRHNIHVGNNTSRDEFVKLRTERDSTLTMPKLILPSLQVNMRAGDIPTDDGGAPMLKIPLNAM